jgi:diguanylate cyclase (GGDEF)-like protein/PAS domain S-box-containing protein
MSDRQQYPRQTPAGAAALRKRAEEQVGPVEPVSLSEQTPETIQQMIHELRVHQIELEMQNEELRTAQVAIEESQARYFDLYDLAPVGYTTISDKGLILEANLTTTILLGVNRGTLVKLPLTRFIFKDDQCIYYLHRKKLLETGKPQGCELRLVKPDGTIFWAHLTGTVAHAEDGTPVLRVVISDITERKQVEELRRFRFLVDNTHDLIWTSDTDLNLTYINPSHERLYGFTIEERMAQTLEQMLTPASIKKTLLALPGKHARENTGRYDPQWSVTLELEYFCADGSTVWVETVMSGIRNDHGEIIGLLGEGRDISERKKFEAELIFNSFHDRLTGLYNRYYLEEEMVRLNTERQLPLAVIMADLNGLKLVNDSYGHDTGDKMLIAAANIIRKSCREEDVIARWGGDEFVVLLPQTAPDEARLICKRITESCQNSVVGGIPLSIALGVANKTFVAKDLVETLREAEDEMYKQKLTESRSTKSAMVTSLLNALAEKSFETEEHTRGMQKIAQKIGVNLNLTDSELHRLELLVTLHDIGKINISENILTKKSSLTDDEWEAIKKHPETGYRIAMATGEFSHVTEDILAYHERWDGGGYPQGLQGKAIPLLARITAIADAYEVMSNGRPYKKAMSKNDIIDEYKKCAGTHFDPELVEILLSVMESNDCDQ